MQNKKTSIIYSSLNISKMKKKTKVVDSKTTFPLTFSIALYLLLVHFNASDFAMGIYWALIAILWICAIVLIFRQEVVNIEDLVEQRIGEKIKPTLDIVLKEINELKKILGR